MHLGPCALEQVTQKRDGVDVRPLRVVDDEQSTSVARDVVEKTRDGIEDLTPRVLLVRFADPEELRPHALARFVEGS